MAKTDMKATKRGPSIEGISLKKQYGQHFLRDYAVVNTMLSAVTLNDKSSVFEIGCGDGFLTRLILQEPLERLWVFEIDEEWATYVEKTVPDSRLTIFNEDILLVDFDKQFILYKPWVLLSNLPYQITFPLLKQLQRHRSLLAEGVIMVQEEVAQKILAPPGQTTVQSLYYGYYFEWRSLCTIPPTAFYPPPAINSRLLYFKPQRELTFIPDQEAFWQFVKLCFKQRRRTLRNNLMQSHYPITLLPQKWSSARAQELSFKDFLELWDVVRV